MEPELFSQEGMELSCRKFRDRINQDANENGLSFTGYFEGRFESCDFEKRTLLVSYEIKEWMRNPAGVMHGGAVATVMDTSMGSLTFFCSGEYMTPTINMNVSYERPVPTGKRMFVESTCLSCGKTMAYATAKAWMEDCPEKIVASASGTYYTASGMR